MSITQSNENNFYKLYRGAYTHFRNNNIYAEESFEVFKDKREHSLLFSSELHSRVATGELLIINIMHIVNKDYIPQEVHIRKQLGEDSTEERYIYELRKNKLLYLFTDKKGVTTERELNTSPRFHIATPASCSSMLFLRSKKFDSTGKNLYQVWKGQNFWEFESEPTVVTTVVEKISQGFESLIIDGQNLQSTEYKLYENNPEEDNKNSPIVETPYLRVFLSKHMTIPYLLKDFEGTKIEVKYLNELE